MPARLAAAHDRCSSPADGAMKRRNALFSFHPAMLTPKQRAARGRVPYNRRVAAMLRKARASGRPVAKAGGGDRSDLVSALVNLGYKRPAATKAARDARGSDFDSMLRDSLKALKNPRSRAATMQKKRNKKKKRNGRKGKMPSGLRKYWAQQRAKKNRRRKTRRVANPKVRRFRPRVRRKAKALRRRRRNPVRRAPRMVKLPFAMNAGQVKKYARALSRATGKRVVIKRK